MSIILLIKAYSLTSFLLVVHHGEGLRINILSLLDVGRFLDEVLLGDNLNRTFRAISTNNFSSESK